MTKLRLVLPVKALRTLYYSMIHPHLLCGITIWGTAFKSYLKRLSNLQNRTITQMIGFHWQSNAAVIWQYPLSPLLHFSRKSRFSFQVFLRMFLIVHFFNF